MKIIKKERAARLNNKLLHGSKLRFLSEYNAAVRQTAKVFGISKSRVHMDVTKWNGL